MAEEKEETPVKEVDKTEVPAEKPEETVDVKKEEKPAEEAGATIKAAPASAVAPDAPAVPDEPVKPAIASDDETYDDFSEFFDDNK